MSIAPNSSIKTSIKTEQNALNQRVAKLIDGEVVEKYLWADLTTLLAIYDKDDNLKQRFAYANGRMPVAMTSNGEKYYLHYDQVGSLRAISRVLSPDNTFEVVKEITYDTFGNILTDTNPSFTVPFGFAGGLYDADTKLTRFGYRDYDAYTGKWTAKDPIGFDGGDSNLYGYVLGDPVGFFDANGLEAFNCKIPLHTAPGTWGLPGLYHQYTCVEINGIMICDGMDRTGSPFWSPGKGTYPNDKYVPGKCKRKKSNLCFDVCMLEEWKKARPQYGIGPQAYPGDCQEYDDDLNKRCWKKCKNVK